MGNKSSSISNGHRRIYIGEVPEIEEPTGGQLVPETGKRSEHSNVNVEGGGTGSESDAADGLKQEDPRLRRPTGVTSRKNSLSHRRWSAAHPPVIKYGKNIKFPSNIIKSSRYTLLTFLPLNILEQFRRIVNLYFVIMIIVQSTANTPVGPGTTAAPLIFVFIVTAAKQGYEDWLRHKADNLVNNRLVNVVRNGELKTVQAREVVVGDVVKIEGEEQVPADIVVFGSSDEFQRCQVSTTNLDGETNLKIRYCPAGLPTFKTELEFNNLNAVIECDQPSADLYMFNGSILIPYDKMLMHRGSVASAAENILSSEDFTKSQKGKTGGISSKSNQVAPSLDNSEPRSNGSSGAQIPSPPPETNFFQIPLSMENVTLRGSKLKNTDYIYGVVIYTGQDSRLAMNSKITHRKFPTVEKTVNRFIVIYLSVLVSLIIICTGLHFYYLNKPDTSAQKAWYLYPDPEINFQYMFDQIATFLVLFNYIIPISLYVTMELQKFVGSKFFVWDEDMHCPVTGQPPLCNTSDLNEELGQIEYLFSDKTGTLTQNLMEFRHCSIGELRFDLRDDDQLYLVDDAKRINDMVNIEKASEVLHFLRVLALCHTVQVMPRRRPSFDATGTGFGLPAFKKALKITAKMKAASSLFTLENEDNYSIPGIGKDWEFQASSPDEKALLEACAKLGVVYLGEKENVLTLDVLGKTESYKRHYSLEFDPDRKCMSVVVEDSSGQIWVFCKGAETTIVQRAESGPINPTMTHIVNFALMGMRTLAVAERKISKNEFKEFVSKVKAARRMIKNREEAMRQAYALMENRLVVLGSTAVEDQLQDHVPETLSALSVAGIRVWMITGDKVETGVNVAISCGLITQATRQLFATNITDPDEVKRHMEQLVKETDNDENTTFIVDGLTMKVAYEVCPHLFRHVAMGAYRVVCCRMTPLQKSLVVNMVKTSPKRPITAAVGDGANDVAMIQEAHIGIGILGKEGRQAARCSDFAVARFSFLKKAILVHGHWYYVRLSTLVIYFFYKNLCYILPPLWFTIDSAFSGQSLFNSYYLTMYNIFFASCPILVYGLQEQPYSKSVLLKKPELYKSLTRNAGLTWKVFGIWHLSAIFHALCIYYVPRLAWDGFDSTANDVASFGTVVYITLLAVVTTKMLLVSNFISFWVIFSYFFSYGSFFIFTSIYSEIDFRTISSQFNNGDFYHVYYTLMSLPMFWCMVILTVFLALTPDFIVKIVVNSWPSIRKVYNKIPKKMNLRRFRRQSFKIPQMTLMFSKRSGKLAISRSNYFSKDNEA